MLADLSASEVFEHSTACGAATEQHWIRLFNRYLPQRYRATSAREMDSRRRPQSRLRAQAGLGNTWSLLRSAALTRKAPPFPSFVLELAVVRVQARPGSARRGFVRARHIYVPARQSPDRPAVSDGSPTPGTD